MLVNLTLVNLMLVSLTYILYVVKSIMTASKNKCTNMSLGSLLSHGGPFPSLLVKGT